MYLISKMNFPFISLRFRHNAVNLLLSYAHQKFSVHQCSVCMCLHNYQNSRITKFLNLTSHQLLSLCTWAKSFQFSSVAQQCLTLCDPTDCSTPGLPVHHQPPEFTQPHVRRVGDAIQPSHPVSSPSPPAFNLSHYQGLFK